MWIYQKRLIYPLPYLKPNPRMAKLIANLLGGPSGEFSASTTYLNQRYCMPLDSVKAILTDIGTEESEHGCYQSMGLLWGKFGYNLNSKSSTDTPFHFALFSLKYSIFSKISFRISFFCFGVESL